MKTAKKRVITGFGFVLLMVLAFALFAFETLHTVVVKGVSMYPTFKDGQRVLVCRAYWLVGPLKDKDVVVLRDKESPDNPDAYIIKRIYKMAGEKVDEVNCPHNWKLANGPYVVPEGKVYVLGDNRAQSEDSRYFGAVDLKSLLGKVVVRR
jgi:signal peptidase I